MADQPTQAQVFGRQVARNSILASRRAMPTDVSTDALKGIQMALSGDEGTIIMAEMMVERAGSGRIVPDLKEANEVRQAMLDVIDEFQSLSPDGQEAKIRDFEREGFEEMSHKERFPQVSRERGM